MPRRACRVMDRIAEATFGVAGLGPKVRPSETWPLAHRLSQLSPLPQPEFHFLQKLEKRKEHPVDALLLEDDGSGPHPTPRIILSGWASRQRIMADGGRQIFGFLIPGEIICGPFKSNMWALASVVALTPVVTADVPPMGDQHPDAALASIYSKLIDLAEYETHKLLHDQIVRLGRMNGLERMAHLLLEFRRRLSRAGVANEQSFPMPLRQDVLADALGMSTVHVNRTMQQLRHKKLISCSGGEVAILDPGRLTALAYRTADAT